MNELCYLLPEMQRRYPAASISDHVKLIYQNEFGCGHLIADEAQSFRRLTEELETARTGGTLLEPVGNGYQRLYLRNAVELGLSAHTLHRLFMITAGRSGGTKDGLRRKLCILQRLCRAKILPFSVGACMLYFLNYEAAGMPPVHHSAAYREAYRPSYRVVRSDCVRFFDLFLRIDRLLATNRQSIIVAIDGACASGKTTLAQLLGACYADCNVFHTDDFFLRPEQRHSARECNMDYERLCAEVLEPLSQCRALRYRPYCCRTQVVEDGWEVPFRRLNILEGSYSLYPALRRFYDVKTVLLISPEHQMSRLKRRESEQSLRQFRERWIPLETEYSRRTRLLDCADFLFSC